MRAANFRTLTILGALAICASQPGSLLAQSLTPRGGQVVVVTAVVPSIVKYVVDESVRTADGAPTVRVVTNDPAIRAAFARGVTPEAVPVALAVATPEQSAHAKGDGRLELASRGASVLRYTVVAP